MLELFNLSKKYGKTLAVRDLSFKVDEGEIVGLLGPNGAGKTTTMRMLTTFLPPSSGTALVAGYDILKQGHLVRENIGYLPETPPLYPELTVKEYLSFVAKIKGVSRNLSDAVNEVVSSCGLKDMQHKLCGQLSKGFRQRVGLAHALVHKPKVIILDEPTSGLDPAQIIEIRQLIKSLRGKHTVILSTHILPEVVETCSRVIIIAHGRMKVEGDLKEFTREKSLEKRFLEVVSSEEGI